MRSVSAAEANRQFSVLLREVRNGETVVVTSHGTPVATIAPIVGSTAARETARQLLLNRLRAQPFVDAGPWTRDELYDDEP
jgi:prevent-host-death family protein